MVATRVGGAFLILLLPSLLLLRRIGLPTGRQSVRMLAYRVVAIALAQLCYFSAVQYLSVGVALLLEYLAPVILIAWHWARTQRRPARPVLAGAGLSIVGLAFVLDLRTGLTLNPVGVVWVWVPPCVSARTSSSARTRDPMHNPPAAVDDSRDWHRCGDLTGRLGGGILPLAAQTGVTVLADRAVGWWLPALLLILISAVLAYPSGIVAVRRLGSSLASFVSLTEVIFAVVLAFVLLGQRPGPMQLLGVC